MTTAIILHRDQMGEGDAELGKKILTTCLRKLVTFGDELEAIVLYNAGVKLASRESHVAVELKQLHDNGVDVLACATCVEHYGLTGQLVVDSVSNMDEILRVLRSVEKAITL